MMVTAVLNSSLLPVPLHCREEPGEGLLCALTEQHA